jgi:hypothetical protein
MTDPFRTHGLDVVPLERHPESLYAFDGTILVGRASPWAAGEPDGDWYARRTGKKAGRFAGRHQALAHIVGGCPDCVCDPVLCAADDTGDSCLDCGYCLNGCSADECDMTKENS